MKISRKQAILPILLLFTASIQASASTQPIRESFFTGCFYYQKHTTDETQHKYYQTQVLDEETHILRIIIPEKHKARDCSSRQQEMFPHIDPRNSRYYPYFPDHGRIPEGSTVLPPIPPAEDPHRPQTLEEIQGKPYIWKEIKDLKFDFPPSFPGTNITAGEAYENKDLWEIIKGMKVETTGLGFGPKFPAITLVSEGLYHTIPQEYFIPEGAVVDSEEDRVWLSIEPPEQKIVQAREQIEEFNQDIPKGIISVPEESFRNCFFYNTRGKNHNKRTVRVPAPYELKSPSASLTLVGPPLFPVACKEEQIILFRKMISRLNPERLDEDKPFLPFETYVMGDSFLKDLQVKSALVSLDTIPIKLPEQTTYNVFDDGASAFEDRFRGCFYYYLEDFDFQERTRTLIRVPVPKTHDAYDCSDQQKLLFRIIDPRINDPATILAEHVYDERIIVSHEEFALNNTEYSVLPERYPGPEFPLESKVLTDSNWIPPEGYQIFPNAIIDSKWSSPKDPNKLAEADLRTDRHNDTYPYLEVAYSQTRNYLMDEKADELGSEYIVTHFKRTNETIWIVVQNAYNTSVTQIIDIKIPPYEGWPENVRDYRPVVLYGNIDRFESDIPGTLVGKPRK